MPIHYNRPAPALSGFLECYWQLEGGGAMRETLFPDGCADVIVNLGRRFEYDGAIVLDPHTVYLGGALTRAIYAEVPQGVRLLGIRFRPGCLGYFYDGISLGDYADTCLPFLHDAGLPALLSGHHDLRRALDGHYAAKLKQRYNPVQLAARHILLSNGNCHIHHIAALCHQTLRSLERQFKTHVGLTPKQFAAIVQLKYAGGLMLEGGSSLLDVALEAGYYDQAHFSREFKKLTGCAPAAAGELLPRCGWT